MDSADRGLARFNALSLDAAVELLSRCVDVPRWTDAVARARPFPDRASVIAAAHSMAREWSEGEITSALAGRPALGGSISPTNTFSPAEQQQTLTSSETSVRDLALGQEQYRRVFGMTFMIRAEGRSAPEVLEHLHRRLDNSAAAELIEVGRELREIAARRLGVALSQLANDYADGRRSEILIINPNTNPDTTAMLAAIAREHVQGRFLVRAIQVDSGPAIITDSDQLETSGPLVAAAARRHITGDTVGVIIGAIGDPALALLRDELSVPVMGIGSAAMAAAAAGGRRFGVVTTTPKLAGSLASMARAAGSPGQFTGMRLTSTPAEHLMEHPETLLSELATALRESVEQDGAVAVVIGGGPLGTSARQLARSAAVAVIEPIPSALDALLAALGTVRAGASR